MTQRPFDRSPFLSLPAEIRLQIYAELSNALHSHVHYTFTRDPRDSRRVHTHWHIASCPFTDAVFPQLCTRPIFSGIQPLQNQGHHTGDHGCKDVHVYALRAVCRLVYAETQGVFEPRNTQCLRSISVRDTLACSVLNGFSQVERDTVKRITLWGQHFDPWQMRETTEWLERNLYRLPNLESFALQGIVEAFRLQTRRTQKPIRFAPHSRWCELPYVKKLDRLCRGKITLIVEAWICFRPGHKLYEGKGERDEMVVVRGVLRSQRYGAEGQGDGVTCTVKRLEISEHAQNAQWKYWWESTG